jgi:hypothetical protein
MASSQRVEGSGSSERPSGIRRWRDCWRARGRAALVPKYPKERGSRLADDLVQLISRQVRNSSMARPERASGCAHQPHVPIGDDPRNVQATRTIPTATASQADAWPSALPGVRPWRIPLHLTSPQ